MNKFDALTSYMAEMTDIMQEMHAKMQWVKEIKAEMDKLKQVETKSKATKVTKTTYNYKIPVNVVVKSINLHGIHTLKPRNMKKY